MQFIHRKFMNRDDRIVSTGGQDSDSIKHGHAASAATTQPFKACII